jgi:hypothetical protein
LAPEALVTEDLGALETIGILVAEPQNGQDSD